MDTKTRPHDMMPTKHYQKRHTEIKSERMKKIFHHPWKPKASRHSYSYTKQTERPKLNKEKKII
jgi:hypothetical protein